MLLEKNLCDRFDALIGTLDDIESPKKFEYLHRHYYGGAVWRDMKLVATGPFKQQVWPIYLVSFLPIAYYLQVRPLTQKNPPLFRRFKLAALAPSRN